MFRHPYSVGGRVAADIFRNLPECGMNVDKLPELGGGETVPPSGTPMPASDHGYNC